MSRSRSNPYRLNQLEECVNKHSQMVERAQYGIDPIIGESVVIHSGYGNRDELETLNQHADDLVSKAGPFLGAAILRKPTIETIFEVIKNPEIANISFIGHGSFSTFYFGESYSRKTPLTWLDLSKASTHLKQGIIEQRTCTTIPNPLKEVRVALPSFIVRDQTRILSTVGVVFDEMHGYDVITPQLTNVYDADINSAFSLRNPKGFILPEEE